MERGDLKKAPTPEQLRERLAEGQEEAKRLLRLLGCVEMSEVCEHDWHRDGTVNGVTVYHCQKCGKAR